MSNLYFLIISMQILCAMLFITGESMEHGLRDCCRSICIGKILIQRDDLTQEARVFYAKFPTDIHRRKVLLLYPVLGECEMCFRMYIALEIFSFRQKGRIILCLVYILKHG